MKPLCVTFTLLLALAIPTGTRMAARATQAAPLRVIAFGAHPDDARRRFAERDHRGIDRDVSLLRGEARLSSLLRTVNSRESTQALS